jgi:LysR family transcriptional activator of nhaA
VAPLIIAAEIEARYSVKLAGRADGVFETFYAITAKRGLLHPGLQAIIDEAENKPRLVNLNPSNLPLR